MQASLVISVALLGLAGWWWFNRNIEGERSPRVHVSLLVGLLVAIGLYPAQVDKDINFFFGDEMIVIAVAQQIADGALLYRDVWEFLQPGSFVLLAGIFTLFGSTVLVLDICTLLLFGAIAACVHRLVARTVSAGAAWLTVLAFVLLLRPLGVSLLPHWMGTLAALLALLCLIDTAPPAPRWRLIAAGSALALTFLFQQHKGVFLAATLGPAYVAACLATGVGIKDTVRAVGWVLLGVVLLAAPLVIWLSWHDLWSEWWYATFEWLREGYGPANRSRPSLLPLDWSLPLPTILRSLWLSADLTVLRLLPLAYLIAPLTLLRREGRVPRYALWLTWAGAFGVFGTALTRYEQFRLMYTAPTTLVLVALTIGRFLRRAPDELGPRSHVATALTHAFAALLCVATAVQFASHRTFLDRGNRLVMNSPQGRVQLWSGGWGNLDDIEAVLVTLQGVDAGSGLFVYPAGWGYGYLSGLRNGTPYHCVIPQYTRPTQWEQVMAALRDPGRVDYVVWDRTFSPAWMRDILPTLDPATVWENGLVELLQSPAWEPVMETPSVTLYRRAIVAHEAVLEETENREL